MAKQKPKVSASESTSAIVPPAVEEAGASQRAYENILERLTKFGGGGGESGAELLKAATWAGKVLIEFGLDMRDAICGIPAISAADATAKEIKAVKVWERVLVYLSCAERPGTDLDSARDNVIAAFSAKA